MKLSNIFKKKATLESKIQTLGKDQLEKVIGGAGSDTLIDTTISGADASKSKHDAAMAAIQNTR